MKEEQRFSLSEWSKEPLYVLSGWRRDLEVYDDRLLIINRKDACTFFFGGWSNAIKTIYFRDIISIQFEKSGFLQDGFIKFETASCNGEKTWSSGNAVTFHGEVKNYSAREICEFVEQRINEIKEKPQDILVNEILKYKGVKELGLMTDAEFEKKRKELLGL